MLSLLALACDRDGVISSPFQSKAKDVAPDLEACGFSLNVRRQRVSLKEKALFYIDKSCPSEFKTYVEESIHFWNESLAKRGDSAILELAGEIESHQLPNNHDGKNVVSCGSISKSQRTQDDQARQAITSLKTVGRSIVNADILIDTDRFCFADVETGKKLSSCTKDQGGSVDLLSVLQHEFGHALGLGHSDDEESLMYPTLRYGQNRRDVSTNDYKNLKCEY